MSDESQYTVTWAYTTFAQDMSPQEAAELAVQGVFPYGDPQAGAGKVEVSVALHGASGPSIPLGEFTVAHRTVTPSYEELFAFVSDVASWRKDGEPVDPAENDGDDTYILENDTAVDLHDGVISTARALLNIPDPEEGAFLGDMPGRPSIDETVGPDGQTLPFGRCDTCGKPCDEQGCTSVRTHPIALEG